MQSMCLIYGFHPRLMFRRPIHALLRLCSPPPSLIPLLLCQQLMWTLLLCCLVSTSLNSILRYLINCFSQSSGICPCCFSSFFGLSSGTSPNKVIWSLYCLEGMKYCTSSCIYSKSQDLLHCAVHRLRSASTTPHLVAVETDLSNGHRSLQQDISWSSVHVVEGNVHNRGLILVVKRIGLSIAADVSPVLLSVWPNVSTTTPCVSPIWPGWSTGVHCIVLSASPPSPPAVGV